MSLRALPTQHRDGQTWLPVYLRFQWLTVHACTCAANRSPDTQPPHLFICPANDPWSQFSRGPQPVDVRLFQSFSCVLPKLRADKLPAFKRVTGSCRRALEGWRHSLITLPSPASRFPHPLPNIPPAKHPLCPPPNILCEAGM